ncbi:MAG: PEGA domain-containing protein [Bacteroidetes bacterium]|nr:PEGA domain-containing protein [Bacteroidota bacterium]
MKKVFLTAVFVISFFLISCREDIVEFAEIQKDSGSLFLSSYPQGAVIFLKDTQTNFKTPEEFDELEPGEYIITLKLDGYSDTTIVVNVESGKRNFLSIFLNKKIKF